MRRLLTIVAAATLGAACNHTPVANLEKSFTLKVEAGTGDDSRVKIDFLWVIDNSSSMCQEQRLLAENFERFRSSLEVNFDVDARIAVTSVDAQCDNNGTSVFAAKGKFNQHVTRGANFTCHETLPFSCHTSDQCSDCAVLGNCESSGEWTCKVPSTPDCDVNPNGSLNTGCQRECNTDEECKVAFGDDRYVCVNVSGNSGCVVPAPTADCPDELPPFLEKNESVDNTDLFGCIANVGVTQQICLRFEQPLKTGYMALDPTGPNADQAAAFLRPDAFLVVILISDEEDCSTAEGRDNMIVDTEQFRCGIYPTTDDNGPLLPVAHYVNKYKALKDDPGRVIVAAISGDSIATDPAQKQADRDAWRASKESPRSCNWGAYICNSPLSGTSDYGGRFQQFATAFGPNGTFQNMCEGAGIQPALDAIADTIVAVINKVCLPKPILDGLKVSRIRNGQEQVLTEGQGAGTYRVVLGAEDCAVDNELLPAITFGDPPRPGDQIKVVYQGDPELP
ncbi:MAG: hypothetical protein U1F43_17435 [Myxococcota bacterium]